MEQQMNLHFNPLDYPTIKCECGCVTYTPAMILKKVPGVVLGVGQGDQIVDLGCYICTKCGNILPQYREMYKLDENGEKTKSTIIM